MRLLVALALCLLSLPALAVPIPSFDDPKALLDAIYEQIKAAEDWENFDADAAFDEVEAFSSGLYAKYKAADDALKAHGEEIGVLDFSPFINGQDSGGMTFVVNDPKVKGDRAKVSVEVLGYAPQTLLFELVDEGEAGWKVDDIILPGYQDEPDWRLSDYFDDPR